MFSRGTAAYRMMGRSGIAKGMLKQTGGAVDTLGTAEGGVKQRGLMRVFPS